MEVTLLRWTSSSLKEELGVTFVGSGAHVFKRGAYYLLLRGETHSLARVSATSFRGKITSLRRGPYPWTSLVTRVKGLHPWSPRTPKDPLYIRLYFSSPLLFFGYLLALGYQKNKRGGQGPKRAFLDSQSYSREEI